MPIKHDTHKRYTQRRDGKFRRSTSMSVLIPLESVELIMDKLGKTKAEAERMLVNESLRHEEMAGIGLICIDPNGDQEDPENWMLAGLPPTGEEGDEPTIPLEHVHFNF